MKVCVVYSFIHHLMLCSWGKGVGGVVGGGEEGEGLGDEREVQSF